MKKALSLICISAALFATISNPAKASPDTKHEQTIAKETVALNNMAVPVVMQYTAFVDDVQFVPLVSPERSYVAADPGSTIQPTEQVMFNKDPLAVDGRLWLYRHYFDPEDLKQYPEYRPDKLCEGYPTKVFHPAR